MTTGIIAMPDGSFIEGNLQASMGNTAPTDTPEHQGLLNNSKYDGKFQAGTDSAISNLNNMAAERDRFVNEAHRLVDPGTGEPSAVNKARFDKLMEQAKAADVRYRNQYDIDSADLSLEATPTDDPAMAQMRQQLATMQENGSEAVKANIT